MFFIKEEQLCGYLPPLALFLYPVLRHYLRSNAGAAEVSEAQFLMVGAHCSPWLQNGLAYAGLAPLSWRGQLCESLSAVAPPCGVIILVIISFSNQGCHYFFVLTEFFFPRGIILWWLWAALCRQHPCLGLVDVHLDLHVETSEKNELL